ncbi:DUF2274 domain-containing protein [Sphingopyxis granuli]|uniref:DUF2274 domain-containing protein n=1 Tax=Sphingopyxis granuli TaxID=267128 RepID=UPI00301BC941
MTKLRLGLIADEKPVKLSLELPGSLHRDLMEYAAVHARTNGLTDPLSPEKIAVPMIGRFIATDRAFARLRKQ